MAVFFNLGSSEPTGSANFLQGSARILKLTLILLSRFRQKFNNVSKVPRLEKGWKALLYGLVSRTEPPLKKWDELFQGWPDFFDRGPNLKKKICISGHTIKKNLLKK